MASSIQRACVRWVRQPLEDISLLDALATGPRRDLYLCVVLKFLRDLLLATPSEEAMTELLGILEPMCDKEEVHEIGSTFEEEKTRQEIYEHHHETQDALVTTSAAAPLPPASSPNTGSLSSSGHIWKILDSLNPIFTGTTGISAFYGRYP